MSLNLVTGPATEPLTTAEAKLHLKVTDAADDTLIDTLVAAARQDAETYTRRAFVTQIWELVLDDFPAASSAIIYLPKPNLLSVTSITYVDTNGTTQTWPAAEYAVEAPKGDRAAHGRIATAFGESWPSVRDQIAAVKIKFEAGYGDAAAVPGGIKAAMKLLIGHLYEHRESVIVGVTVSTVPQGYKALLSPYRAIRF